jgi:hypothetical protein
MNNHSNSLTDRQENFCEYGGAFGVMLSLTCLIQHLVVSNPGWVTHSMFFVYVFAIFSFLMLGIKKHIAPILLIISGVLSILLIYVWMREMAFSLVVISLFAYHVIMLVCLYVEQVPQQLKRKRMAEIEEEHRWAGKI